MARPVKWTEKKLDILAEKMRQYFNGAVQKFEEEKDFKNVPFISTFCRKIGKLSQETLLVKAKKHEPLSDALKEAKEIQKEILILGGLQGRFNPTAFIFTAKNITDMRDSVDVKGEVTSNIKYFNLPKPYATAKNGYTDPGLGVGTKSGATNRGTGI